MKSPTMIARVLAAVGVKMLQKIYLANSFKGEKLITDEFQWMSSLLFIHFENVEAVPPTFWVAMAGNDFTKLNGFSSKIFSEKSFKKASPNILRKRFSFHCKP